MEKRQAIRDSRSVGKIKTRIFDLVIPDGEEPQIEVKDGKMIKRILLSDMEKQISDFTKEDSRIAI